MSNQTGSNNSFAVMCSCPSRIEGMQLIWERAEDRLNGTILKICEDVLFLGLTQTTEALRDEIENHNGHFKVSVDTQSSVSAVTIEAASEKRTCRIEISCSEVYQLAAEQGCSIWTAAANVAAIYFAEILVLLARKLVWARISEEKITAVEAEIKPQIRSDILKALCSNNFTECHLERRCDDDIAVYRAALRAC